MRSWKALHCRVASRHNPLDFIACRRRRLPGKIRRRQHDEEYGPVPGSHVSAHGMGEAEYDDGREHERAAAQASHELDDRQQGEGTSDQAEENPM